MKENESFQPIYRTKVEGIDIMVPMRDGTRLAVDVYRPDAEGRFPTLLSFAAHNKFLQSPEVRDACGNQPAWAPLWCGPAEASDTRFFTARGYVHVVGNLRGCGNPDVSVQTAREGKMERPQVPEREVTRGWLKASHRAGDEEKSRPDRPFHPFTRSAQEPVVPAEINKYDVEIAPTSNVFKRDHRICVEITSLDVPTGVAGDSAVE